MNNRKLVRGLLLVAVIAVAGYNTLRPPVEPGHVPGPATSTQSRTGNPALEQAFEARASDVQVEGSGVVVRVLADDTRGSRHQRFILRVADDQTVLVAHNIDLSPRINGLHEGDRVAFYGEYEWNDRGGVIHWTHRDPANRHPHGWLRHNGRQYD